MKITKRQLQLLKEATQLIGVSGQEKEVRNYLQKHFEEKKLPLLFDELGSIYAYKKGTDSSLKVMISGHMDEVGFITQEILSNGLIKVVPIGGVDERSMIAHRAILKNSLGKLFYGAVTANAPHLNAEAANFIKQITFDFGFRNKKEAEKANIKFGDQIILDGPFQILNKKKRLLAKAFDNRYSIALIIDLLDELENVTLPFDLYLGANVQEEVGLRGATTASNLIKPDLAIVLDCSPARDTFVSKEEEGVLGEGVLIRYLDRAMIGFPKLLKWQEEACKETKVKYQYFHSTGGTDAGAIHKSQTGVLTLTHCICARGLHSPSTIIDVDDYLAAKKVLLHLLKNLNYEKYLSLKNNI
ncbi:MAG: M42 family metallopeptidase [Bacilli bacterium]|jgi:glutamyl aminopeptidase|nr:M42 family metallopeptidase [Bacilli bacterium]NLN80183.1 M42 family metallopeptidase [Erysipelotrichia bacterium]